MKSLVFALLLLAGTAVAQEDPMLAVLKSDAPLKEKADACRELARVGTRQAVPVLAPLLADEQLSYWARMALEPIADPSVDAALRDALGRVQGPLLAGVIHSVGVRRDAKAVTALAKLLGGADATAAQAAARALGCIGGTAVPALENALSTSVPATRLAVCEGLLRCAETLPGSKAASVYAKLQAMPDLPNQVRVAAFRGAVRSRGDRGIALLTEAIRTGSPVATADALRLSMELPGAKMTRALVKELADANEEKQILLLRTLGNRGDATAAPLFAMYGVCGSTDRRIAALQSLVQLRYVPSLPTLAEQAKNPTPAIADAAWTGLAGFPRKEADAMVVALLSDSNTKTRIAAVGAVGQRRIAAAVPALLKAAGDADAGVASAGFKVLGDLAGAGDIPALVDALCRTKAVGAGESGLLAVCARQTDSAGCADQVLPGLTKAQGEAKLALLRVLGSLGGPKALAAVRAAAAGTDPEAKETAQRTLCDWPTAEALADLAQIATSSGDASLKQLALRGQIRLIPLQSVPEAQKAGQVQKLLPSLERPEEQRLALAALGSIPCVESLALLKPYLTAGALKEEAGLAAVAVAEKTVSTHPAEVAATLPLVSTADKQLAERIQKVLAQVPPGAAGTGFTPLFNGTDLTGWDGKPGWWKVEDGALTAESTPDRPCAECNYLVWTGGQPADFELIADFRLSGAGNSGIQLRSKALANWDTSGYQADMSGDGALVGFVYEHTRGLIAGRGERVTITPEGKREVQNLGDAAELAKLYKKEDWNTYRILCQGPEITLFINGTLMCQFTDRDAKQAASKGIIALQMHPGPPMKIQFKNLRMKMLN